MNPLANEFVTMNLVVIFLVVFVGVVFLKAAKRSMED